MNPLLRRLDPISLAFGAALGVIIMLSIAASTNSARTTWEYRIVQGKVFGNEVELGQGINAAVAEGWEFVSASSSSEQWGFAVMRREKK